MPQRIADAKQLVLLINKERHLTFSAIANAIGITKHALLEIKNGRHVGNRTTVARLQTLYYDLAKPTKHRPAPAYTEVAAPIAAAPEPPARRPDKAPVAERPERPRPAPRRSRKQPRPAFIHPYAQLVRGLAAAINNTPPEAPTPEPPAPEYMPGMRRPRRT